MPAVERRRLVTFSGIHPILVHAIISAEDKHFFQHSGLDLPRVLKAAWVDFRHERKAQGASTLAMQLVRGGSGLSPTSVGAESSLKR